MSDVHECSAGQFLLNSMMSIHSTIHKLTIIMYFCFANTGTHTHAHTQSWEDINRPLNMAQFDEYSVYQH